MTLRKLLKSLTSRLSLTVLLILIQVVFFFVMLLRLGDLFIYLDLVLYFLSIVLTIYLINDDNKSPSLKLPWILAIVLFPLLGGIGYLLFGRNAVEHDAILLRNTITTKLKDYYGSNHLQVKLAEKNKYYATDASYIHKVSNAVLHNNTKSEYFPIGEAMFDKLCEMLEKAEHYIFLEFFIVQEGEMFDKVLDILKDKANKGVEVRFIYDDLGCIKTLPGDYYKKLESYGIKCGVFNPFRPIVSIIHNNRNHRKIAVVDGYMGISGGINLADEYINKRERFGHWKDTAIYLEGEAVHNLTLLFLEDWYYCRNEMEDYGEYAPFKYAPNVIESDGYYQSYGDSPLDEELCAQNVFINVLSHSTDYVYITTPYLIIDYDFLNSIKLAAKRGIDIRIITPHIPDKWYVHMLTRAFYHSLLDAGVRIYEYTPGFIHAKTMVSDDSVAIVGTINLDYRSLVHNYECATIMYYSSTCMDIKADFEKTLEVCEEMTIDNLPKHNLVYEVVMNIIKLFAPLM